jgi:5-methylcytosine-specific restriction enzyme subunit McrC
MTHLTVREWGDVRVESIAGRSKAFTDRQAIALCNAARAHPNANRHGTNILIDRRDKLVAQQMVGVLSAPDCSLEILPKLDPDAPEAMDANACEAERQSARIRLVQMLDVAFELGLSAGSGDSMAHTAPSLLEILIANFADKLLTEVRRGLPRRYLQCENDLSALRGRLDVTRQFSRNAVRPDRLACRFDQLEADTPLLRIVASAVPFLQRHARLQENRRKLSELRHWLHEVPQMPIAQLPWKDVRITRANKRWGELHRLAELLLRRNWQSVDRDTNGVLGITLLFPMNDLFEKYVAMLLRRALAPQGIKVLEQGGHRKCLGQWSEGEKLPTTEGQAFSTKPDIRLEREGRLLAVIDTKWKKMVAPTHKSHGLHQGDVYQLMAYARLYDGADVALLYPSLPGQGERHHAPYGIAGGGERFDVMSVDVSAERADVERQLATLCQRFAREAQTPSN